MKQKLRLFIEVSLFVTLIVPLSVQSQIFTKITQGPIVADGGASRSVNWVDYDSDGYLDLFVSNGLEGGQNNFLYRNNHDGTFAKIMSDPLVTGHSPSDGASWSDFDNDGDLDAFVVAWYDSNNALYINDGNGSFTQVFTGQPVNDHGYSENSSWGDYDNDGNLDLYVTNSGSPSLGAKANFLYRNNGDGTFTKITTGEAATDLMYSRGISWVDYDNDNDLDLFITNERSQNNTLYKNLLTETGQPNLSRSIIDPITNSGGSSFGASWGDVDNDGDLDVFVTNGWPTAQLNFFNLNNGDGSFARVLDDTIAKDIGNHFGSAWGDFDNDGDLDLYVTTSYGPAASKNLLYQNQLMETGVLSFQRVAAASPVNDLGYSYACAWGDYDRDGDLDLVVAKTFNENENNALYRNDNNNGNHWLEVRCVGSTSNRSGIGARIKAITAIGGQFVRQFRAVEGQSGNCSQNLDQHFGLGNAMVIDSLRIEWPSGTTDIYTKVAVDRIVTALEGAGLTGVEDNRGSVPREFELFQNYPNPFNPTTKIRFSLSTPGFTSLRVYDILGQMVSTVVSDWFPAGDYSIDYSPNTLASGTYYYQLSFRNSLNQNSSIQESRKMLLLR